ncbi:hypothetical protein V3C99_013475 [Haemonchus contortus]|uniref:Gamma interferon inducible lysosomal thiol reductase GILT n=1 Tax=Haemonchus contortus TaxID=6289 RepID=A0A7I4XZR6_HAECO
MLFFLALIFGVAPVYTESWESADIDRCSVIPPAFWCTNKEIMKSCGFTDVCKRHNDASYNQPINITVLIEALCPDCQRWITESLPTIFKKFNKFVNIEFIPYGNAKVVNGSIECQHGAEECSINRFESCVIDSMGTQDQYVPYIYCLENQLKSKVTFDKASAKCFRTLSVSDDIQRMIQSCLVSRLGEELQMKAAEATDNVWPDQHRFVPWIVINGVSVASAQTMMDRLPNLLCEWYIGDKPIPYCQGEEKKRRRAVSWKH